MRWSFQYMCRCCNCDIFIVQKKSWLCQVTQVRYSLVGAWRKKSLHSAMSNIWQVKMSSRFKDLQMKSGDESTLLPSSVKSSWRRPTCSQNLLMRSAAEMLFSVSQVDSESSNWNHFKWHFVSVRHTSWWRFAYPHQVLAVEGTLSVRSDISNRVYIHSPLIHHSRLWQPWCSEQFMLYCFGPPNRSLLWSAASIRSKNERMVKSFVLWSVPEFYQ